MSSIWSRPTPTRSHAPFIVIPSRSSSRKCDKELPYRANGVRTPPSTKASVMVDLLEVDEIFVISGPLRTERPGGRDAPAAAEVGNSVRFAQDSVSAASTGRQFDCSLGAFGPV